MEETLRALGGILLKALPTFFLVILLHFYLKYTFFRPLQRVLGARLEATEGARKLAEAMVAKAFAKAGEYEAAIRAARAEIYQEQEQLHHRLQEQRAADLRDARVRAEAAIKEAKGQLALDVAQATQALAAESDRLADRIAESILTRSAG
jgi:F-type H+-transporting ATPase subunit b